MALLIEKILENETVANYHMIIDVTFSRRRKELCIYWAGFKDKSFRDLKWSEASDEDNTEKTMIYTDILFINGQDFIDNILPHIDDVGPRVFCYKLLKERIDYFSKAQDI